MQNVLIDDWSEQSLSDLAVRLERVPAAARHGRDDAAVARHMKSFVCSRSGHLTLFMAAGEPHGCPT
jgi:hypothetical protein